MKYFSLTVFLLLLGFSPMKAFPEAEDLKLPSPLKASKMSLEEAIDSRLSVRNYRFAAVSLEKISQLLWAAYGRNSRGKITCPSAGARYPLVIYLSANNVEGLKEGVYRYNNKKHSLSLVSEKNINKSLAQACFNQDFIKDAAAVIIITADYGITAAVYGQRARRYVDIETGHCGQNIYLQVLSLGLGTVAVGAFDDDKVKDILGVAQEPVYIMPIGAPQ